MTTRKTFLKSAVSAAAGFVANSMDTRLEGLLVLNPLRPPGAVDSFHDACTSCAACAEVCPERAIVMLPHKLSDKLLPTIDTTERACVMCKDTPCIAACDDGALVPRSDGLFPSIGLAVVRSDRCLSYNGSVCMTCHDACPLKRTALKFEMNRPVVDAESCTGCGQCEYSCPVGEKGIVVEAR